MEQQMKLVKQMVEMQKLTFESMMSGMFMFWKQTEQTLDSFLNQAVWMPEQGKSALRQWIEGNKKACEYFKNAVEEGYGNLEKYFSG